MTPPPRRAGDVLLWTCDGCGVESVWTPFHEWSGDSAQGWSSVVVACSASCQDALAAAGRMRPRAFMLGNVRGVRHPPVTIAAG